MLYCRNTADEVIAQMTMKRILAYLLCFCLLIGHALAEGDMVPLDNLDDDGNEIVDLDDDDDDGEVPLEDDDDELPLEEVPQPTQTPVPAPSAPRATPAPEEPNALRVGNVGEDVRTVQTRLATLGYYTGDISGRYGEKTAEAVRAFQRDHGLNPTGNAGTQTCELLQATRYRPLYYGVSGVDVKRAQLRLAQLGFYGGKISGNFLDSTVEAVKAYQVKMGETPTGDLDAEQIEVMYSESARSTADTALPRRQGAKLSSVGASNGIASVETVPFKKKLVNGNSNRYVKQVQQRLIDLGYYNGDVTGNYKNKTVTAVKEFQAQNGLTADGVTDEATWNALFNDPYVVLPGESPRATPEPTPPPYHIVVDVNNQVVTVYARDEDGEYTVVVRQMICSSGTTANPSPAGDFVLNGRHTTWCLFPKWGDYARYWTQITPSIAFHSVLYNTPSTMDLRTASYTKLGKRASHGCIRLLVSDAKWVYDHIGAGTVVTITYDLPKDPELKDSVQKPSLNTRNMLPVKTPYPTQEPIYIRGAQPPMPLTQLGKGDSSAAVYWLQCKLTELGYYSGKCSGTYLDGTAAAVKAFQSAAGLRTSGTADVATLEKLYASELAAPATFAPDASASARTPAP